MDRKKTGSKKELFLEALALHAGVIAPSCKAVGISRVTVYNWLRADINFKERYDEITETQIDRVESSLLKRINEGDTTAIIFYLKTKGKKRGYSESDAREQSYNVIFERVE